MYKQRISQMYKQRILPDGSKYEGKWKDDKRNGKGTLIWPDGLIYEGQWKDGKMNGQGTSTYLDGQR
jgi:hypothetical protein